MCSHRAAASAADAAEGKNNNPFAPFASSTSRFAFRERHQRPCRAHAVNNTRPEHIGAPRSESLLRSNSSVSRPPRMVNCGQKWRRRPKAFCTPFLSASFCTHECLCSCCCFFLLSTLQSFSRLVVFVESCRVIVENAAGPGFILIRQCAGARARIRLSAQAE